MKTFTIMVFLLCLSFSSDVFAQNYDAVMKIIAPTGVYLGMSVAELRRNRPTTFDGPRAFSPDAKDKDVFTSRGEIQGMGAPRGVSHLYLCSHNRIVGVLRTESLIGVSPKQIDAIAHNTYRQFVKLLGNAQQDTLLRKGRTAFVEVRADVWQSVKTEALVYFVATNQEMTTAIVEASDFPLAQIFIRPDPQRFPLESSASRSIIDVERPSVVASGIHPRPAGKEEGSAHRTSGYFILAATVLIVAILYIISRRIIVRRGL